MRHGIPTVRNPIDPKSLYIRNLFHTFFWGPFVDEAALTNAVIALDKADPYWDYDPFCIICGANPLPSDFVFGFKSASPGLQERVEKARGAARAGDSV